MLKKIFGLLFIGLYIISIQSAVNEVLAKPNQNLSNINKTKKKSAKTHYVIIYKDETGKQQTYNTYAKSKDEAKHNLYQSRKVTKILNVSTR